MGKTKVKFDAQKLVKDMFKRIEAEQTERFVNYAKERIKKIGQAFEAWNRTGNLLGSLCWIVYHNGTMARYGYYTTQPPYDDAYLHELSKPPLKELVVGRTKAQTFIAGYTPKNDKGWEIVFAVTAPYWGYWEEGHFNVLRGEYMQFAVMAEQYDEVRRELTPCNVTFDTYTPKY